MPHDLFISYAHQGDNTPVKRWLRLSSACTWNWKLTFAVASTALWRSFSTRKTSRTSTTGRSAVIGRCVTRASSSPASPAATCAAMPAAGNGRNGAGTNSNTASCRRVLRRSGS